MNVRGQACAYCGEPAVNADHVVPKSLIKKHERDIAASWSWVHEPIPPEFLGTVPSCIACNVNKGTRRLVPPSWEGRVAAMNAFFGGTPWRTWDGDPMSAAFREVHV